MEEILMFLSDNYLILVIISLFLIFALIGYFVEMKNGVEEPFKIENDVFKTPELNLENIEINNNVSLNEMFKGKASVKQENIDNNMNNGENPPML